MTRIVGMVCVKSDESTVSGQARSYSIYHSCITTIFLSLSASPSLSLSLSLCSGVVSLPLLLLPLPSVVVVPVLVRVCSLSQSVNHPIHPLIHTIQALQTTHPTPCNSRMRTRRWRRTCSHPILSPIQSPHPHPHPHLALDPALSYQRQVVMPRS